MFLLKNRGLRVQLFVGLLLVLAALPERSEGLECYVCEDGEVGKPCKKQETCGKADSKFKPFCTETKFEGPYHVKRKCFPVASKELFSKCLVEQGYTSIGNGCYNVPHEHFVVVGEEESIYSREMKACVSKKVEEGFQFRSGFLEGRAGGSDAVVKVCACDTDLCNGNSQQQHTPSSKLTFAILILLATAGFYSHIQDF